MTAQRTGKLHKKWKTVQTRKRISILLILFRIFLKLLSSKTLIFTVKIMKDEQNLLFTVFKSFASSFLTERKQTINAGE